MHEGAESSSEVAAWSIKVRKEVGLSPEPGSRIKERGEVSLWVTSWRKRSKAVGMEGARALNRRGRTGERRSVGLYGCELVDEKTYEVRIRVTSGTDCTAIKAAREEGEKASVYLRLCLVWVIGEARETDPGLHARHWAASDRPARVMRTTCRTLDGKSLE